MLQPLPLAPLDYAAADAASLPPTATNHVSFASVISDTASGRWSAAVRCMLCTEWYLRADMQCRVSYVEAGLLSSW